MFGAAHIPQAKTLSPKELRSTLDSIASNPHSARNRLMLLMTRWAGMRVGEVAALRIRDVRNADRSVKQEIRLDAAQTKGKHARVVFVSDRLRKEIDLYLKQIALKTDGRPLFSTQKRAAFSTNTLCQTMNAIYRRAGIDGATNDSEFFEVLKVMAWRDLGASGNDMESLAP